MLRLNKDQWASIREVWESDPRSGFDWLVAELDINATRQAVSKAAKSKGWAKKGVSDNAASVSNTTLAIIITPPYPPGCLVRIAFYTTTGGVKKRQVIALDGFYLNALILVAKIGKQDVPRWVQAAVDGWPDFDGERPITRQVKYLIVNELETAYRRALSRRAKG